MKYYRCYFLSPTNAIKDVAEFECVDDRAALREAHRLLEERDYYPGFELWEGPHIIHSHFAKTPQS